MHLKKKIGAARKIFNLAISRQIAPNFLRAKICPNKVMIRKETYYLVKIMLFYLLRPRIHWDFK